jgi:TM2 domain-containing membrane protein YozV
MRRAVTHLVACLALAVLCAWQAHAAEPSQPQGDPLAFADSLCRSGDYFRAIGEYKRVLFSEAGSPGQKSFPSQGRTRLHMAACYARAGGLQEASDLLNELVGEGGPEAEPALFELALAYYQAGLPEMAAEGFERYRARFPAGPRAEEAQLLAGLSRLAAADYGTAAATLAAVNRAKFPCAATLAEAAEKPQPPERSPLAAGLLAAGLPGAGHLYCGRPVQAGASFLFTGASVFGAYAALRHGYVGAGTLAALVAATAYAGSIRSAVSCAQERNRAARRGWLARLAEGCDLRLTPGGVALSY